MPLEWDECERRVRALYRAAGVDPGAPSGALHLVGRLPGVEFVEFVPHLSVPGRSVPSPRLGPDFRRIQVRKYMSRAATAWFATHEGHEVINATLRHPYVGRDIELVMNALTAATLIPADGLRAAWEHLGFDIPALSQWFAASEPTVALRIGEVFQWPVAIVGELWIPRRGPERWLPGDSELRRIVAVGHHPAVRLVPIRRRRELLTAVFLAPAHMDIDCGISREMAEALARIPE